MIHFTKAKAKPKPKKPTGGKKAALNKLKSFLTAAEPEAVEILVSGLQGQSNAITYKELREAYLAGGISEKQFKKWQKDYSKLITSSLAPKWREAAAAGAGAATGSGQQQAEGSSSSSRKQEPGRGGSQQAGTVAAAAGRGGSSRQGQQEKSAGRGSSNRQQPGAARGVSSMCLWQAQLGGESPGQSC